MTEIVVHEGQPTGLNRAQYAQDMHNMVVSGATQMLIGLHRINREELFVELGYSSMIDYMKEVVPVAEKTAYAYLEMLNEYGEEDFSVRIERLGRTKLQYLTKISSDDRAALLKGEAVEFPDGQYYTEEQLEAMTSRQVKAATKPLEDKINAKEEENFQLQEEAIHLRGQIQQMREDLDKIEAEGIDGHVAVYKQRLAAAEHKLRDYTAMPPKVVIGRLKDVQKSNGDLQADLAEIAPHCIYAQEAGALLINICDYMEQAAHGLRKRYQTALQEAQAE